MGRKWKGSSVENVETEWTELQEGSKVRTKSKCEGEKGKGEKYYCREGTLEPNIHEKWKWMTKRERQKKVSYDKKREQSFCMRLKQINN